MDKEAKKEFIEDVMAEFKAEMLRAVDRCPDYWNGFELRWLLSEKVKQYDWMEKKGKRYKDFKNTLIVENF